MSDLLKKAMLYQYPEEIPVNGWILPSAWFAHGEDLARIVREYPDICSVPKDLSKVEENMSPSYHLGVFVDEWGCVWENSHKGSEGIVKGHPVPNREDILKLEIPKERKGNLPHGFMYLRILDLRGFEEAMIDFAEECDELQILIDKIVEYNMIQIDIALPKQGDIMFFGDDLGMQNGLAIGAEKWRKYLKPCYAKMYKKVRDADKLVYMHTDGKIDEIMSDLVECGVNMINPQFRANGLDNLVRVCKGKIPINLDLDRQMFPFATPSQIDEHVRECVEALYLPEGGLGLNIEISDDIPLENVVALFDAVQKYSKYKG